MTVPAADKADFVIRTLARYLLEVRRARAELAEQFETELSKHPDGPILMSMPGVGSRTAVTMLVEIWHPRFANAGHLAVVGDTLTWGEDARHPNVDWSQ